MFGTCNTAISFSDCTANLARYASQLQTSCSREISQGNSVVLDTQTGLLAYPILRDAGCLISQAGSQSYCYVEAVHNTNPADLYLYQLPLGIAAPNNSDPSCSACAGSVLGVFATALQADGGRNEGNGSTDALKMTYDAAAALSANPQACGAGYASVGIVTASAAMRLSLDASGMWMTVGVLLAASLSLW